MYKNDILDTLTGNQPDLKKIIEEQAHTESNESVTIRPISHKRGTDSKPKQLVIRYNNSVNRHK